jgi:hypothetical protein
MARSTFDLILQSLHLRRHGLKGFKLYSFFLKYPRFFQTVGSATPNFCAKARADSPCSSRQAISTECDREWLSLLAGSRFATA